MKRFVPNTARAPSIYVPDIPVYSVRELPENFLSKKRLKKLLRKDFLSGIDPATRGPHRVRAGAWVVIHVSPANPKLVSSAIVAYRRNEKVVAVSKTRIFEVTFNKRHPIWQDYRKRAAVRKVEWFIAKQRNAIFRNFLKGVHENRKNWQSKGSDFEADATAKTNACWPKKHKAVSELLNLLRYTYG